MLGDAAREVLAVATAVVALLTFGVPAALIDSFASMMGYYEVAVLPALANRFKGFVHKIHPSKLHGQALYNYVNKRLQLFAWFLFFLVYNRVGRADPYVGYVDSTVMALTSAGVFSGAPDLWVEFTKRVNAKKREARKAAKAPQVQE
eukprot:Rhum_TRINITY_DN12337_c1_g1::Rhum_TRINITY_DN12337_c1_g1_i1::g.51176::m.51176